MVTEKRLLTDEEQKRLLGLAGDDDGPSQVANLLQQISQLTTLISELQDMPTSAKGRAPRADSDPEQR